jgi:tetratricopeptide (TPR) repeat protein
LAEHNPLAAARHLQAGQRWDEAAELLLAAADELVNELHADELLRGLDAFKRSQLAAGRWREAQILRADLYRQRGRHSDALAACRAALRVAAAPMDQARVYRRMGKLYEKHNQLHALGYYQQAAERFPDDAPELVVLLKDRAWLYILRQEWAEAEADLTRALALVAAEATDLRADIYDALASLARHRRRYPDAISHGRAALALREEMGDLLRVANSFNNLGLIYNDMGDYRHAIAAFREAQTTYATLGNAELAAGSLLNIGLAQHLDGRLDDAIRAYRDCLARCQAIGLPLVEARAHANLVEALAAQGRMDAARRHWEAGLALSRQAGFDDEIAYYRGLERQFPALNAHQEGLPVPEKPSPRDNAAPSGEGDTAAVMELARREGRVTPRRLMETLGVSKATATRRLAELVAQGALARQGKGRGAYYELAETVHPATVTEAAVEIVAALREQLYHHWEPLRNSYRLAALGVVAAPSTPPRLAARFIAMPDLPEFFQLEAALARLLNREIDLLPEAAIGPRTGQEPAQTVAWVWS